MRMTSIVTFVAMLAGAATSLSNPSLAQEGGRAGIAFVQAPEMSSGICTGKDAASAFSCARQQCIDGGGTAEDCVDMAYCFPALYSVQVSILHNEGLHWQEFFCGWDSREAAMDAAKVACDVSKRPYISECVAAAIYDEDGNKEDLINQ